MKMIFVLVLLGVVSLNSAGQNKAPKAEYVLDFVKLEGNQLIFDLSVHAKDSSFFLAFHDFVIPIPSSYLEEEPEFDVLAPSSAHLDFQNFPLSVGITYKSKIRVKGDTTYFILNGLPPYFEGVPDFYEKSVFVRPGFPYYMGRYYISGIKTVPANIHVLPSKTSPKSSVLVFDPAASFNARTIELLPHTWIATYLNQFGFETAEEDSSISLKFQTIPKGWKVTVEYSYNANKWNSLKKPAGSIWKIPLVDAKGRAGRCFIRIQYSGAKGLKRTVMRRIDLRL